MKLIYTHPNPIIVANARNILQQAGFDSFLKNEHLSSVAGEISPFDAWQELWLADDNDFEKASAVLDDAMNAMPRSDWRCNRCGEENDASFEICWHCGTERA